MDSLKRHSERRQAERKKAPGNKVFILYRGKKIGVYTTRNISVKGVFLESETTPIPLGAVVQLVFLIVNGNITKTHRKSAIITRVADDGYGAGFIHTRSRTRQ